MVESLINRLNRIPMLHGWAEIVLALTSFPEHIGLKEPATSARWERKDWAIYERVIHSRELLRSLIYGDYALEYPDYQLSGGRIPRARLRYSSTEHYIVDNGASVKKPNGYKSIFPVAVALASRPEFKGATFGLGDKFISELAKQTEKPGTPWQWRWASTDHHLRLVVGDSRKLHGFIQPGEVTQAQPHRQVELL